MLEIGRKTGFRNHFHGKFYESFTSFLPVTFLHFFSSSFEVESLLEQQSGMVSAEQTESQQDKLFVQLAGLVEMVVGGEAGLQQPFASA